MNFTLALNIIFLGLVVWLIYEHNKNVVAKTLEENKQANDKVKAIDKQIDANDQQVKQEQDKLKEDEKKDVKEDDMLKYLDDPNHK